MATDEELLKPSREHIAYLDALIEKSESETLEKIERVDDDVYERELWRRHYANTEPLRRERDCATKAIADFYGLQASLGATI